MNDAEVPRRAAPASDFVILDGSGKAGAVGRTGLRAARVRSSTGGRVRALFVVKSSREDSVWSPDTLPADIEAAGIDVVATVRSWPDARRVAITQRVDVLCLDDRLVDKQLEIEVAELAPAGLVLLSERRTVASYQQALRLGAAAVVPLPITLDELVSAVDDALRRSSPELPASSQVGRVVTLVSFKGGVGKSLLAVNLAHSLAQSGDGGSGQVRQVLTPLFVDLGSPFGGSRTYLDYRKDDVSVLTLVPALDDPERTREDLLQDVKRVVLASQGGVHILPAPTNLQDSGRLNARQMELLLALVRDLYSVVIVDGNCQFDRAFEVLLERSDLVLVVTTPDLAAVDSTRLGMEYLRNLDCFPRVRLIANRMDDTYNLSAHKLSEYVRNGVWCSITDDPEAIARFANKGLPVVGNLDPKKYRLAADLSNLGESVRRELAI